MRLWPWGRRARRDATNGLMCQQLVELLTDYFDGSLPPEQHRAVEAHLAACEHCTQYTAQLRATIALTGRLTTDDVSPEAMDTLLDAFRNWSA